MKRLDKDPAIILLTGLGVNYRLLYPYKLACKMFGWKCEVVKNSSFSTDDLDKYSYELIRVVEKYDKVITIGISLGGLATANALYLEPRLKNKILKAYTICSPVCGRNQGIMDSKLIRFLMSPLLTKLYLPKSLLELRKLGEMFDENQIFEKIKKSLDKKQKDICNYYHDNDFLVLPSQATLEYAEKKKVKYQYRLVPKVFHHHMACSDPRIFFEILKEINNKY